MQFKVYHVMNKPIELADREAYAAEWKVRANELIADKPKSSDLEAWQAINSKLDDLESELQAKFPCTKIFDINSVHELQILVKNYGTVSFCLENDELVAYIMDLPESHKVSTNQ